MAQTFYSYLAYIQPSSNANILTLKNNLQNFYEKQSGTEKPEIVLDDNQIEIIFDDSYSFYIAFNDEEHVLEEAIETADQYDTDWNEDTFDKQKLKTSKKRFEIWGDDDFDMDYFNDSLFIIEQIEKFNDVIILQTQ